MKIQRSFPVLAILLLNLIAISTAASSVSAGPCQRYYRIDFQGTGTYNASATSDSGLEYFLSMEQEVPMAWKTTYTLFFDESDVVPTEPYGISTFKILLSGTLQETGISERESPTVASPYSCTGPISDDQVGPDVYVMNALTPGYMFTIDGFNDFVYGGDPCTGSYQAYPGSGFSRGEDKFTASVLLKPLDMTFGKVVYNVKGPSSPLPSCLEDNPNVLTCAHSLKWTGTVTFTLLRDFCPPYVRPKSTSLKATAKWKVPTTLQTPIKQMGDATGTVTLVPTTGTPGVTYGKASFKILHNRAVTNTSIPLNFAAQKIIKRKGRLKCTAVVKGKDVFGTATIKTPVTILAP